MRSATEDTEIRGRTIAKGDWLWLAYPSGNRDEEVFDDPDAFRPERNPNRHLAFGYGAHLCLGQHWRRWKCGILWEELLAAPSIAWSSPVRPPALRPPSSAAPKRLPIRYRMS